MTKISTCSLIVRLHTGMFTFSPLISILIDEIGWKGTLGIVAAITGAGTLGALLFRPLTATEEQVDKVYGSCLESF